MSVAESEGGPGGPAAARSGVGRWRLWARIGITAQFAALVRILAEYFRLRHTRGPALTLEAVDPWVVGALTAAALCWVAVTFYFFGRHRTAVALAIATVVVLLLLKFVVYGDALG